MSDEQTIYISPEDDLTTVRERLEQIPTKRVTLVIPAQTQLRSHVAWKLLYARARELNKEVLIVSSDPQVRSVAHAVKFKVAHSLEAPPTTNKPRPASRPGRPVGASKSKSAPIAPAPKKESSVRARPQGSTNQWSAPPSKRIAESAPPYDEEMFVESPDDPQSPAFDLSEKSYGQAYDYNIDTSPPIRPLSPDQIEEPDLLLEDYTHAQDIRQAASGKKKKKELPPAAKEIEPADEHIVQPSKKLPLPSISDDPFAYMDDSQPPPKAEQRGAALIEGYDTNQHAVQDVPDMPTSIMDSNIEYQYSSSNFVSEGRSLPNTRSRGKPAPIEEIEEESSPPIKPNFPRTSRSGTLPKRPRVEEKEEQAQVEIDAFPTQMMAPRNPVASSRTSGALAPPKTPAAPRGYTTAPAQARPSSQRPQPRAAEAVSKTSKRPSTRRRGNSRIPIIVGIVLLIIAIGALAYFVPSAQVTITVATHEYDQTVSTTASIQHQAGTIPAIVMEKNFSRSGSAQATGSHMASTGVAKGFVCFNNSSDTLVDIPSQLTIATSGTNVQYQTEADTVYPAHYACTGSKDPYNVPIHAVKSGESGNVQAGTITVIPDESLSTIATYNKTSVPNLRLTVKNAGDVAGGGVQPVSAVAAKDLEQAKTDLHKQAQGDIDNWQKSIAVGGVAGPPATTDILVNPPTVDTTEESGSFPVTLTVRVTALFVSNADLQQAGIDQLNSKLRTDKNYTNYVILGEPVKIDQVQVSPAESTAIKLQFHAVGRAAPEIKKENVQSLVVGTTIANARTQVKSLSPNIQKVDINTTPGFIPWITNWAGHINVTIKAGTEQPTK